MRSIRSMSLGATLAVAACAAAMRSAETQGDSNGPSKLREPYEAEPEQEDFSPYQHPRADRPKGKDSAFQKRLKEVCARAHQNKYKLKKKKNHCDTMIKPFRSPLG